MNAPPLERKDLSTEIMISAPNESETIESAPIERLTIETTRSEQETIAREIAQVRKIFGLSETAEISYNPTGWTSRVYLYGDGELVAKFPRSEEIKKEYSFEVQAYQLIQGIDHVDIPEIVEIGSDYSFVAYKGIIGQTLDNVKDLNHKAQEAIGTAIGGFLRELHKISTSCCNGQSIDDEIKECIDKFEMGRSEIIKRADSAQIMALEHFIHEFFPAELRRMGEKSVYSHGDLGYWNMVCRSNGRIGVIDFGDAGFYDESRDFVGLANQKVLQSALSAYGASKQIEMKAAIRKVVLPVVRLPYYIGKRNPHGVRATISRILKMINNLRAE